jgi:23S rRNA pseudouridine2457 synthase
MTAAVGLPTLRLVRIAVAGYALGGLAPGAWTTCAASAPPATATEART